MNTPPVAVRAEASKRITRSHPARLEVRDTGNGTVALTGYASVTETPYPIADCFGEYVETISRGAFRKTLAEQADVRLLVNHDGIPLARTKSGTLQLAEDEHGLRVDAPGLDVTNPVVAAMVSALQRGDLDAMSFAFRVIRQTWAPDYSTRRIEEVSLADGDVSVVSYPANPATAAGVRSLLAQVGRLDDRQLAEVRSAGGMDDLRAAYKRLHALLNRDGLARTLAAMQEDDQLILRGRPAPAAVPPSMSKDEAREVLDRFYADRGTRRRSAADTNRVRAALAVLGHRVSV